ncbi:NAD-dependent DNA ligase [Allorhodopirellula heiligendammensis]|uniref:BRCT domain-containing protein n=1 Tax=Allorhodopirellula heiligendammensis TaxID=2714739 RepID=A0A5C6C5E8_9BACT|nr:NAD-dependent DNA ligase [Allorhodopirellula heiligendammensis]TWU18029.1 hypothetical protein Poly21_01820 [Allorhodopirellula heiligendammensis]
MNESTGAKPRRERDAHFRFTGPARLSRAVNTLEGFLLGITIDSRINDAELATLAHWVSEHSEFADRHPFDEFIPILIEVLTDKSISEESRADLLWACGQFHSDGAFYTGATADMQRLQGILSGIIADGLVTESEVRQLTTWLHQHDELKTVWPYAEIDSVLMSVLADGVVDAEEQAMLLDLFTEYSAVGGGMAHPSERVSTVPIKGVCACDPVIHFDNRNFCFTGKSDRCDRTSFAELITGRGSIFKPRVTKDLHYLVVGASGNPCWAYSCYGRKVEQAATMRMNGSHVLIVHEFDLWDAIDG